MISIIIPFFNEEKNIVLLFKELGDVMEKTGRKYEIIFVDDGSTDRSLAVIQEAIKKVLGVKGTVKVLEQRKRFGKGEALVTGLKHAEGEICMFMDADLQDNPEDIPKFLKKIDEGSDLVNGARTVRKDNEIIKFYSKLGNLFLRYFLRSPFTDINCGFKAIRKSVLDEITLYGNNFRFLPVAAYLKGFKVNEVAVENRMRIHGKSKFGKSKAFIGFLDTITAYFLYSFSERPLHFFGIIGGALLLSGFLISVYLTFERVFFNILLYRRPALFLGILLIIVGIQIVTTGILGELIVYIGKKNSKS